MTSPDEILNRLHAVARTAAGPSEAVREQIFRNVAARSDGASTVAVETQAPDANPSSAIKLIVTVVTVTVAVMAALREPEVREPQTQLEQPSLPVLVSRTSAPAMVHGEDPMPPAQLARELESTETVRQPPITTAPKPVRSKVRPPTRQVVMVPTPDPSEPRDRLAEEIALIKGMASAMNRGQHAKVLELVADHETRIGPGAMLEEREAARVRATCGMGAGELGRALEAQFIERWPHSVHLGAMGRACRTTP